MAGRSSLNLRCRVIQDVDDGISFSSTATRKYSATELAIYNRIHLREESNFLNSREAEVAVESTSMFNLV